MPKRTPRSKRASSPRVNKTRSARPSKSKPTKGTFPDSVFINCPFDDGYRRLFRAIVFTICDAGFHARCALEESNAADVRVDKIMKLIGSCKFGIHDISRTEVDPKTKLPRFNMPLELGMDLSARKFGNGTKTKVLLVLDREQYRYQKFMSDISGQDIKAHDGEPEKAVKAIRDWLRTSGGTDGVPGEKAILRRFKLFETELPRLCKQLGVSVDTLIFVDLNNLIIEFLKKHGR